MVVVVAHIVTVAHRHLAQEDKVVGEQLITKPLEVQEQQTQVAVVVEPIMHTLLEMVVREVQVLLY